MELKNEVKLVKRFDEHDCVLTWSASAPAAFIATCVDEFKAFVAQKIKEMEEKPKVEETQA